MLLWYETFKYLTSFLETMLDIKVEEHHINKNFKNLSNLEESYLGPVKPFAQWRKLTPCSSSVHHALVSKVQQRESGGQTEEERSVYVKLTTQMLPIFHHPQTGEVQSNHIYYLEIIWHKLAVGKTGFDKLVKIMSKAIRQLIKTLGRAWIQVWCKKGKSNSECVFLDAKLQIKATCWRRRFVNINLLISNW